MKRVKCPYMESGAEKGDFFFFFSLPGLVYCRRELLVIYSTFQPGSWFLLTMNSSQITDTDAR